MNQSVIKHDESEAKKNGTNKKDNERDTSGTKQVEIDWNTKSSKTMRIGTLDITSMNEKNGIANTNFLLVNIKPRQAKVNA